MPFQSTTPPHLRQRRFVEPLSHERLLNICYAYRRLKEHVEHLQADINEALEEFQHSQHGRASGPLEVLITKLSQLDAGVSMALMQDIHQVDLETMHWEMKSSKLRSEAQRQRRLRAERNNNEPRRSIYTPDDRDPPQRAVSKTERLNGPDEAPGEYRNSMFAEDSDVADATPTGAAALVAKDLEAVKLGLPASEAPKPPTNDSYKKSGLV